MFDSIVRCFRPACADCGRLTDARRDAAAEALQQCIERTYDTIVSAHPSPLAIQAELVGAARAANELKRVGGGTRAVVDGLERDLRSLSAQHLTRLAKALRSPQVAEAEKRLRDPNDPRPGAEQLLMHIEAAINGELTRRLETPVRQTLAAVLAGVRDHAPGERIADLFHHAFDAAVPLAKLGALDLTREGQLEVDRLVMRQLDAQPEDDLKAILRNVRSEDLTRLLQSGQPDSATVRMVRSEIETRPAALADKFLNCHQRLCNLPAGSARLAGNAFLNSLAATAAAFEEIETHCALHLRPMPQVQPSFAELQWQVRAAVSAALTSGRPDPSSLGGAQLLRLSRALNTLGIHDCGSMTLRVAEQAHIMHCRAAFQQKLQVLVQGLAHGSGPASMLRALDELDDASSALRRALAAFNTGGAAPAASSSAARAPLDGSFTSVQLDSSFTSMQLDGSFTSVQLDSFTSAPLRGLSLTAPVSESDLITGALHDLPPDTASALAGAFGESGTQALIASLHAGAELAGDIRETVMAERFANMARLCEQIAGEAAADNPAPALSSLSPAERQQFAAQHLTDAAREALQDAYALVLPADGAPSLHAGRFDPLQTRTAAQFIESPASTSENALSSIGRFQVSTDFLVDVSRDLALYISDSNSAGEAGTSQPSEAEVLAQHRRSASREVTVSASPQGRALIDRTVPLRRRQIEALGVSADERLALSYGSDKAAYIANAYAQLVELCGDEKQARILTFYAHQGIVAGLRTGLASEGTPLVLPDGTPGVLNPNSWSPSADQPVWDDGKRLTFSIGESGRPQMEVDYWIAGRAKFSHLDRPEVGPYLSPDSYLHTHFRTELNESGSLTLLEAPSYRFHLRPDDLFQKRYPQPTVAVLEAANQGNEMVRDALWYSQHIGMEQYLVALRAVAAFEREPTAAHVVSVVDACHGLPARDNDPVASAVLDLPPNPSDLEERRLSPELFAALHEALRNVIEEGVLPGMIEAIREGAL